MTALNVQPEYLGYAPAREARLDSERALRRALPASFAVVTGMICALGLAARFVTAPAVLVLPPVADVHRIVDIAPARPRGPSAPRFPVSRPGASNRVPVVVPDHEGPVAGPTAAPADPGTGGAAEPAGAPAHDAGDFGNGEGIPQPGDVFFGEQLPRIAYSPTPVYPDLARDAGVDGVVTLWALVDLDGSVRDVRVIRSVPLLDEAATAAVRRWRFTPALSGGHPVRVWIAVPVRFSLR